MDEVMRPRHSCWGTEARCRQHGQQRYKHTLCVDLTNMSMNMLRGKKRQVANAKLDGHLLTMRSLSVRKRMLTSRSGELAADLPSDLGDHQAVAAPYHFE
eukprot:753596-Hanusia_phi.AAC.2